MSFFTALADAYGGFGAGRQQRTVNQQDQQRLASETAYQNAQIEEDKARTKQEGTDEQLRATQAGYQTDPATGQLQPIPLKPGYAPAPKNATPEQMYDWARNNYARALSQNDQQGMSQFGDAITKLSSGYQKETSGDVNVARVPFIQAQTDYWRNWRTRAKMQYDAALQRVGVQQSGAMQRAYLSANTRTDIAGRSADEREAIAVQTALNVAQGRNQDEAYREAVNQANRQDAENLEVWKVQNAAALKASQPGIAPPALTPITVNSSGPPITVNVVDPATGNVRRVAAPSTTLNGQNPATGHLPPIQSQISQAEAAYKAAGKPLDISAIRNTLLNAGYSAAQVNSALRLRPPSTQWQGFGAP